MRARKLAQRGDADRCLLTNDRFRSRQTGAPDPDLPLSEIDEPERRERPSQAVMQCRPRIRRERS